MAIQRSHEIWHRDDFSLLCNWRKLWTAVEVGVDRGEFSQCFLSRWQGTCFIGVDNYEPYEGMPWDRQGDYRMALMRYERFAKIAKLITTKSTEFAKTLQTSGKDFLGKDTVDFVYIDAAHDHESVANDILAWWPLLKEGGILAGHDFDHHHKGVIEAVTNFAEHQTAYLTHEATPSWYVYKGGIPGPEWKRC